MKNIDIAKEKRAFVKEYPDYKADVEHFFRFIEARRTLNDSNRNDWFCGVKSDDVQECLEHLCQNKVFNTKSKARNFSNALAKFFNYLLAKGLQNDILRKELKGNFTLDEKRVPYHENLMKYIAENPELLDEKIFSPICLDEMNRLIEHCDKLIDMRISYEKGSEPKIFGQASAALCVKLILFTGISYGTARLLAFDDLKAEIGLLVINGMTVMLPPKLSYQFREYARIYIEKELNTEGSKLFLGKNGEQWGESTTNSGIIAVLRAAIEKSSISEINRYAIQQHIINGLPERTILELTGEKNEVLRKCYDEIQGDELFSFVNSALVKNPIYRTL